MKAYIEITSCMNCPHHRETNYHSDGFDRMVDWVCGKENNRKIQGAVEWHEERGIKIPEWCPINEKNLRKDE